MMKSYVMTGGAAGERLDVALAKVCGLTRSAVHKRIQEGYVKVDGQSLMSSYLLKGTETVTLDEPIVQSMPSAPDLPILYEDNDVLAVDKPADLAVHLSESGRPQATVAAFAAEQGVEDDDDERPGIVHRLDKDTSGVMLISKNMASKADLQRQFQDRSVKKTYLALVYGRLRPDEATIRLPIARDRRNPTKRAVVPGGRPAVTRYKVLEEFTGYSLVEIELETGRTHQIRVHLAHLGHQVAGDSLYGGPGLPGLKRQFLHAARLEFSAMDGSRVVVESPLPPDLEAVVHKLRSTV